jgi:hypothetical protein
MLNVKVTKEVEKWADGDHIVYTMRPNIEAHFSISNEELYSFSEADMEIEIKRKLYTLLTKELLQQMGVPTETEIAELQNMIIYEHPEVYEEVLFDFLNRLFKLYDSRNYEGE